MTHKILTAENSVTTGTVTVLLSPFANHFEHLIVMIIVAVVLVLADLRFGVEAAMVRGESVRFSRALRRTINKVIDYICWLAIAIVLGGSFGDKFGIPLLAYIIMAVIFGIELTSIFDNYFESRGLKKRFNFMGFFSRALHLDMRLDEFMEDKPGKDKGGKE